MGNGTNPKATGKALGRYTGVLTLEQSGLPAHMLCGEKLTHTIHIHMYTEYHAHINLKAHCIHVNTCVEAGSVPHMHSCTYIAHMNMHWLAA